MTYGIFARYCGDDGCYRDDYRFNDFAFSPLDYGYNQAFCPFGYAAGVRCNDTRCFGFAKNFDFFPRDFDQYFERELRKNVSRLRSINECYRWTNKNFVPEQIEKDRLCGVRPNAEIEYGRSTNELYGKNDYYGDRYYNHNNMHHAYPSYDNGRMNQVRMQGYADGRCEAYDDQRRFSGYRDSSRNGLGPREGMVRNVGQFGKLTRNVRGEGPNAAPYEERIIPVIIVKQPKQEKPDRKEVAEVIHTSEAVCPIEAPTVGLVGELCGKDELEDLSSRDEPVEYLNDKDKPAEDLSGKHEILEDFEHVVQQIEDACDVSVASTDGAENKEEESCNAANDIQNLAEQQVTSPSEDISFDYNLSDPDEEWEQL